MRARVHRLGSAAPPFSAAVWLPRRPHTHARCHHVGASVPTRQRRPALQRSCMVAAPPTHKCQMSTRPTCALLARSRFASYRCCCVSCLGSSVVALSASSRDSSAAAPRDLHRLHNVTLHQLHHVILQRLHHVILQRLHHVILHRLHHEFLQRLRHVILPRVSPRARVCTWYTACTISMTIACGHERARVYCRLNITKYPWL